VANSRGSIHIVDNSVTSINEAIRQLLDMIDELSGEHDTRDIRIGPHSHTSGSGGAISHNSLSNVTSNQHHDQDHNTRHESGGADAIKLDDLASPDDNTDLNASASAHGLLPKLSGNASDVLRGDGTFGNVGGQDSENVDAPLTFQVWEHIVAGTGI